MKTLYIKSIDGCTDFQDRQIDMLEEPICMNIGVAFMPFMQDGYTFLKEENISSPAGFNEVETGFVKYLYKIRKYNRTKQKLEYTTFSGPNALNARYRVFIAGKIFPIMKISYGSDFKGYVGGLGGNDADCTKIELKDISYYELFSFLGGMFDEYKRYGLRYISIDNGKIKSFCRNTPILKLTMPSFCMIS